MINFMMVNLVFYVIMIAFSALVKRLINVLNVKMENILHIRTNVLIHVVMVHLWNLGIGNVKCVIKIVLNVLDQVKTNVPNVMKIWILKTENAYNNALINFSLKMDNVKNVMPVARLVSKEDHYNVHLASMDSIWMKINVFLFVLLDFIKMRIKDYV